MATTAPPTIDALPAAPDPANRATFNTLAYPWSAALPTFGTQVSALGANVKANADDAATSATTATTQASTATTQANTATTQAGIATTKASDALASANGAAQSAIDAAALLDQFDDRYLGVKSSDPALDNDGNALVAGAIYINSVSGYLRAYTGSAWVQGISEVAGVSSLDAQTGALTLKTVNSNNILGSGNIAVGDVTLAGVQSLTNKTITDIVYALTGTTPAFTATNGAVQTWTLTAASTPTNSLTSGQSIILVITPGAYAITWPTAVWTKQGGSGAAPTLFSAGKTSVVLWMVGAVLYGSHLGDTV